MMWWGIKSQIENYMRRIDEICKYDMRYDRWGDVNRILFGRIGPELEKLYKEIDRLTKLPPKPEYVEVDRAHTSIQHVFKNYPNFRGAMNRLKRSDNEDARCLVGFIETVEEKLLDKPRTWIGY